MCSFLVLSGQKHHRKLQEPSSVVIPHYCKLLNANRYFEFHRDDNSMSYSTILVYFLSLQADVPRLHQLHCKNRVVIFNPHRVASVAILASENTQLSAVQ